MDPLSPPSLLPDSDKQGRNNPPQLFLFYSGPPQGKLPRSTTGDRFIFRTGSEVVEEEVKDRAKRAAAAARRWREYSRKGADRPPTFKLPEAMSNKE